ncbi:MAG: trypsin-like serine protease [Acidobacteria bacterium]|nr:trypsin-like serine protease [Acidobacteriota bacterium]
MSKKYLFASIIFIASQASAIVVSSGTPDNYLSAQTAVGFSNVPSVGLCSGSLLATGQHFLTAAHCILGYSGAATVTFTNSLGANFYYTSTAMIAHPNFVAGQYIAGNDIAIIKLNQQVDASINRLSLYTGGGNEQGSEATLIGYGRTGVGTTGSIAGTFGTRREGQNVVDNVTGNLLYFDFDNGNAAQSTLGGLGLGTREVSIAQGDSGGPALINGKIAGINSFITCVGSGGVCLSTIDVDSTLNSTFGEQFATTRVSTYLTWINQNTFESSVPEPSTYATGLLGLVICLAKARKTRNGSSS